jgi:hypothetical protein
MYVKAKGSWNDLLTQSAGQTLLEVGAAVGAFNQQGIEIAFREAFLTAVRDSSIFAIAAMLGVRLSRKSPAVVTVKLTRAGPGVSAIPEMSQFTVGGKLFYNRNSIVFETDTVVAFLYEGQVVTQQFTGETTPFREIILNEPGFQVSNTDVIVSVVNTATAESDRWNKIHDGIWIAAANATVYQDFTDGAGDVVLRFGNGEHGGIPGLGYVINVTYARTSGALGNNGGSGLAVAYNTGADAVTGTTQNSINGGSDEKPASFYRSVAPYIFRAKNRAVTATDYRAIAQAYPGVASVTIQSQRDIAPRDLRWMNVIRVCVLPESTDKFNDVQWKNFRSYMESKVHAAVQLMCIDATKISTSLVIRIAVNSDARPNELEAIVRMNIQNLFRKDVDSLGRRIAQSDIVEACNIPGVDYVEMVSPKADLMPLSPLSWFSPDNITITPFFTERRFSKSI